MTESMQGTNEEDNQDKKMRTYSQEEDLLRTTGAFPQS
jgi:hypothetical protein